MGLWGTKQFSYEYLKSIQNVLTERMEELGIHRIGIKQKDNVVDVYMNSDATEEINDYLHQNIENFDTMAVRVHVDDPEMDFVAAKPIVYSTKWQESSKNLAPGGQPFLKLEISVVGYYDSEGQPFQSEDFAYSLSCFCNLETLEIEHLRIL